MYQDFSFNIKDVAGLLNLHIRHKNTVSLDVDCPFCGDKKGKLNLNLKKNVFKCNRCGESGGMLALYGKVYGVDNQTAFHEIEELLGKNQTGREYQVKEKIIESKEPEILNALPASDEVKNKTYTTFFSMLVLSNTHKEKLLSRGLTEEQIEKNGYKSTPVFGFKKITKKLIESGCTVEGVPGFYQTEDGEWTIYFNPKSSGFIIPVRNIDGLIVGAQIRLDHPYKDRKYIWLSSVNFHMGTTSGSPIHLSGEPGAKTIFVTEGPLKGDISYALTGRTFLSVPGANQYANLEPVLKSMKELGTEFVYEAYDMDKLLNPICKGDYNEKCKECPSYHKDWKNEKILCDRKQMKRNNIQRGCGKLAGICRRLEIQGKTLTWDVTPEGNWAERLKGIDDYLFSITIQNK